MGENYTKSLEKQPGASLAEVGSSYLNERVPGAMAKTPPSLAKPAWIGKVDVIVCQDSLFSKARIG